MLCLASTALLWLFIYHGQLPVTKEKFDRIKDGMSESEVKEILGKPFATCRYGGLHIGFWQDSSSNRIDVHFDSDGKVSWKNFHFVTNREKLGLIVNRSLRMRGWSDH